ncbi:unnamed protein product [marine sediment metagenome]|uniref:Uncharacterized protein n=1 Tax=marine sediment metagenome TaxID=412755 RepID=X1F7Q3_9ZZZZ
MEMEIVGYNSRIKITQVLPCVCDDVTGDPKIRRNKLLRTSWLYDPFGDNLTYGVELSLWLQHKQRVLITLILQQRRF